MQAGKTAKGEDGLEGKKGLIDTAGKWVDRQSKGAGVLLEDPEDDPPPEQLDKCSIVRIISGGQTGADRGGLEAAMYCGVSHGGYCPKDRRAEDGVIPEKYKLEELAEAEYPVRTEANVVHSDCTVIFGYGELEGGSLEAAECARKHHKPLLHIDLNIFNRKATAIMISKWLNESCHGQCIVNVAGQRESKAPGIEQVVKTRMIDVLSTMNPELRSFHSAGE